GAVRAWAAGLSGLRWKVGETVTGGEEGPVWLVVECLRAEEPVTLGLDCCPEFEADDLT
ncbi:MAG: hypothetical protein HC901_04115, partial [Bdellovibrionaceae bacterium]|nr:hypothetical protein [Pseudobdellovibrionaceae bacterium]